MPINNCKNLYRVFNIKLWLSHLKCWNDKLKDTILTNLDYEEIINKYNTEDTFYFIDPPYENSHEKLGYAESKLFDFERLLLNLKKIEGKFLLTINDSTYIRQLFKDYHIIENITSNYLVNIDTLKSSKLRRELFITNY